MDEPSEKPRKKVTSKLGVATTSRHVGVSFNAKIGKWVSMVSIDGVRHYCGAFDNEDAAADARARKIAFVRTGVTQAPPSSYSLYVWDDLSPGDIHPTPAVAVALNVAQARLQLIAQYPQFSHAIRACAAREMQIPCAVIHNP